MRDFKNGREICRAFYEEILAPQLKNVPHDAVLVGEGSDVLGYDQMISRDHNWGVRCTIFTADGAAPKFVLPETFHGISVSGKNIQATTVGKWLMDNLGISDAADIPAEKWLSLPQQHILQFTGGYLLGGNLGAYRQACAALSWYPDDIWRWMLASQWYLIWSEERLIPRTRDAGDSIGSQLIVHRLLRYIFQLHFLQCRCYQPYDKWFGTAFHSLPDHELFEDSFRKALSAAPDDQIAIIHSMLIRLGEVHNTLRITKPVSPRIIPYEVGIDDAVRPYRIINASEYIDALTESISDEALRRLPLVGGIDQLGNTTDVMINFSHWKSVFEKGYVKGLKK